MRVGALVSFNCPAHYWKSSYDDRHFGLVVAYEEGHGWVVVWNNYTRSIEWSSYLILLKKEIDFREKKDYYEKTEKHL